MKNLKYSEFQSERDIAQAIQEASGYLWEEMGGGMAGFVFSLPNKRNLIFGFINGPIGWNECSEDGAETFNSGEIDIKDATVDEMVKYIDTVLEQHGLQPDKAKRQISESQSEGVLDNFFMYSFDNVLYATIVEKNTISGETRTIQVNSVQCKRLAEIVDIVANILGY